MSDTSNCRVDIFKDTYKVISKMRKILSQKGYTDKQKTIEDPKKAVWYLNDEISTLEKQ